MSEVYVIARYDITEYYRLKKQNFVPTMVFPELIYMEKESEDKHERLQNI
jgi:hypothetical protein